MGQVNRLPSQFPEGTRFIIEGRAGRVISRRLEFPDGRQIVLPADHGRSRSAIRMRRLRKPAAGLK